MNDFDDYQDVAKHTATGIANPDAPHGEYAEAMQLLFYATAVSGEVGELNEKIKKTVRTEDEYERDVLRAGVASEMGDVLWYLAMMAELLDLEFGEDVAFANIEKLADRAERDEIFGEGDNR